jgi:hypothetical protein
MKVPEMKKILINGFKIRGREIETVCKTCGKQFLVDTGVVARGMIKHGACTCSCCGKKTLIPVHK